MLLSLLPPCPHAPPSMHLPVVLQINIAMETYKEPTNEGFQKKRNKKKKYESALRFALQFAFREQRY